MAKKIISILLALIMFVTVFSGCTNQEEYDEIVDILTLTMEDSSGIVEEYSSILYGEHNQYFQDNYKKFSSEKDYQVTFDSVQSQYWLALVRENMFDRLYEELEARLSTGNVERKLYFMWVLYSVDRPLFEQQSILNMLDVFLGLSKKQDDVNIALHLAISAYLYYRYFDMQEDAQTVKDYITSLEKTETSDISLISQLSDTTFSYESALLVKDQYDEFEKFFLDLYTQSQFCAIQIDMLLVSNSLGEDKDVKKQRLEVLLKTVEKLYKSETERLGRTDTLQLVQMEQSITEIKVAIEKNNQGTVYSQSGDGTVID